MVDRQASGKACRPDGALLANLRTPTLGDSHQDRGGLDLPGFACDLV